ncbi:hypothetical protein JXA80_09635 [bacterium]|nr:hypothetical protein [candidate division CSSED10-310 bacterium]
MKGSGSIGKMVMILIMVPTIVAILILTGCGSKQDDVPIPAESVIYLRLENMNANWDQLKQRETIAKCMQWQLWKEPFMQDLLKPVNEMKQDFRDNTGLPLNETTIMSMLGRRVDIAVVPTDRLPAVILVTNLGHKSTPMKQMSKALESLDGDRTTRSEYLNHDIIAVRTQPQDADDSDVPEHILYTFHRDDLIVSTDRELLQSSIALLENDSETLMDQPEFTAMMDAVNCSGFIAFVRPGAIADTVGSINGSPDSSGNLHSEWIGMGAELTPTGIRMASVMKPSGLPENVFDSLYPDDKAIHQAARWLSSQSIMGIACGVDTAALVDHEREILGSVQIPDGGSVWSMLTNTLQNTTGMDIPAELAAWGGDGVFFGMNTIRMALFVPVPDCSLGITVSDPAAARDFMNRVVTRIIEAYEPAIQTTAEVILPGNHSYRYFPVAMIEDLQPGYVLIDNMLIIGTSASSVTENIMAFTGDRVRLLDAPAFSTIIDPGQDGIMACKAIDPTQLAQAGRRIVDSLSLLIVAADHKPSVYYEILDTIAMITACGGHIRHDDRLILSDGVIEFI